MSLLPIYRKNGSRSKEDIINSIKNEQLLTGLKLLNIGKSTHFWWKSYPLIPNFQEIYFWDVIQELYKIEKIGYSMMVLNNDRAIIFNPSIKNFQLFIWAFLNSNDWIPYEFVERHPIMSRLLRVIPFVLATNNDLNSETVNHYFLRQYLHAKLGEKSVKQVENPYAIRRLMELEEKYAGEYERMMKKDKLQEFENLKTIAILAWENIFSSDLMENKSYKRWLKKHPAKPYRVSVRDAFPKEVQKDYPFTIPMFEEKLEKLRKK